MYIYVLIAIGLVVAGVCLAALTVGEVLAIRSNRRASAKLRTEDDPRQLFFHQVIEARAARRAALVSAPQSPMPRREI